MSEITRMEIGQLVADAFRRGPAGRDELISSARENGADEEALVLLDRLRDRRYRELRDLWIDLLDVPVGGTGPVRQR